MAFGATQGSANSDEEDVQAEKQTDSDSSRETSKNLNESHQPTEERINSTSKEGSEECSDGETQVGKKATGAPTDAEEKSTASTRRGAKGTENANSKTETDLDSHDKQMNSKGIKKGKKKAVIRKPVPQLSNRLEYLARPTKDFLDSIAQERLDGAIPENAYPFWNLLPLQTKIPFAQCPMPIGRKQIGTNLFLPPPAEDFDLFDENNLQLPSERYDNMHDPHLKGYLRNKAVLQHLKKEGYVTESERATCSLRDIHVYRRYQRRIQAAKVQKQLRDEDEEFRKMRSEGMDYKAKRDMQKYQEKRSQGMMRWWIKNTVASIQDSSMKNQMIRDMKVLNSKIRRRTLQKRRVEASRDRYDRVYTEHTRKKYADAEKIRREMHLELAKKDLERLEKLCKKEKEEKLERKERLKDFWKRKLEWQEEWISRGQELEDMRKEEKERNIDILKRKGRLPVQRLKKNNDDNKEETASKTQAVDQTDQSLEEQDDAKNPEAQNPKSAETDETKAESGNSSEESLLKSSKPRKGDSSETTEVAMEGNPDSEPKRKHG